MKCTFRTLLSAFDMIIAFKIPIIESLNPGTNPDRNFHTKYRTSVFHFLMCCTISLMLIASNFSLNAFLQKCTERQMKQSVKKYTLNP